MDYAVVFILPPVCFLIIYNIYSVDALNRHAAENSQSFGMPWEKFSVPQVYKAYNASGSLLSKILR